MNNGMARFGSALLRAKSILGHKAAFPLGPEDEKNEKKALYAKIDYERMSLMPQWNRGFCSRLWVRLALL